MIEFIFNSIGNYVMACLLILVIGISVNVALAGFKPYD